MKKNKNIHETMSKVAVAAQDFSRTITGIVGKPKGEDETNFGFNLIVMDEDQGLSTLSYVSGELQLMLAASMVAGLIEHMDLSKTEAFAILSEATDLILQTKKQKQSEGGHYAS